MMGQSGGSDGLVLRGRVTETSLELPKGLPFEEWREVGGTLGRIGRAHQWWIGDWLNHGQRAYGERYREAIEVLGYKYGYLANLASIAKSIKSSQRCESLSWTHHREVAALPPAEQKRWLKQAETDRLTHRQLRTAIAARPAIAPPDVNGAYPVVLADPPWKFDTQTSLASRATMHHYPTMSTEDICALTPPAAKDAVLFCWALPAMVAEALQVLDAWGFTYRSQLVWVKDRIGLGYWVRSRHELLLIAARGGFSPPDTRVRPDSVLEAPRLQHSRKPEQSYELIERAYPDLPRVELFARERRPGWDAWGNEIVT
jgi:N6-adenosine-specific RNA methylase IME4